MKKTEFWYGKLKFWIRGMYVVMGILLVLLLLAAANKIAFPRPWKWCLQLRQGWRLQVPMLRENCISWGL